LTASRRVQQEPAWLLHYRPFRDTSLIIDVLSREHGRLSLVARGSRSAKSRLRGILRPFLPLQMSWVIRSDLGTLTGAEMHGAPVLLAGDALLSGYYVNELVLNLVHRHDPQPDIFDAYRHTIIELAGCAAVAPPLRRFEIELLRMLGYALNLRLDTETRSALQADRMYEYRPEQGPVPAVDAQGPMIFSGDSLIRIERQEFEDADVLRDAGRLLRDVLNFHLGGRELKSRKVLKELRRGSRAMTTETNT